MIQHAVVPRWEEALRRMIQDADTYGVNAVIDMRFGASMAMQKVIPYGNRVVLE